MIPIEISGDVPQANSCLLYFLLTDYDGVTPVSVANITTATLTLRDHVTGAIINDQEDEDVKNSFNESGVFAHVLLAADNQIQATGEKIKSETHVAIITIIGTGADGAIEFKREFWITIVNQQHVANA